MYRWFTEVDRHPHLIELLGTFEYQGNYHLIFPWAKFNLRSYWQRTPKPRFSSGNLEWFLRQLVGLAAGVSVIHGYHRTQNFIPMDNASKDDCDDFEPFDMAYRRHGDIKPENILCFNQVLEEASPRTTLAGTLVISDYGSMKRYKTPTVLRSPSFPCTGTLAYASPGSMSRSSRSSRADDVWSLGCVYLEFAIWIMSGWKKLCEFNALRGKTFYTTVETSNNSRRYLLSAQVDLTLRQLLDLPKCSPFIDDLLKLVTEMLGIQPNQRLQIEVVHAKLSDMLKLATADSSYLTIPLSRP